MRFKTKTRKDLGNLFLITAFTLALAAFPASSSAQSLTEIKAQAKALYDAQRFPEALPILEKIAAAEPNDPDTQYYLGFALLGQGMSTPDAAARKALRIRARNAFIKAIDLGIGGEARLILSKAMAGGIPADGSDPKGFSEIAKANEWMDKGEAAFASGRMDDALAAYQAALKIDPRLYYAALYSGDVYMHQQKYADAEIWYQKAIAIDPFVETGYRYSATPLMKQGKHDLARDRYIEAFIVAPYSRLALSGLVQWGEATGTPLGHPRIDIPKISFDAAGKSSSTVNVDPLANDGSMAWASYLATRAIWRNELFAKKYPAEKVYRHSLEEEADALRNVVKMARDSKPKTLHPQIAILGKLDDEGLLEAYILIAIPDQGIAVDHALYLRKNRDKLRQYVAKYVIGAGR